MGGAGPGGAGYRDAVCDRFEPFRSVRVHFSPSGFVMLRFSSFCFVTVRMCSLRFVGVRFASSAFVTLRLYSFLLRPARSAGYTTVNIIIDQIEHIVYMK